MLYQKQNKGGNFKEGREYLSAVLHEHSIP